MNLSVLLNFVEQITAIAGGATIELRQAHIGGIEIVVSWVADEQKYKLARIVTRSEIANMHEAAQPEILEQFACEVREAVRFYGVKGLESK